MAASWKGGIAPEAAVKRASSDQSAIAPTPAIVAAERGVGRDGIPAGAVIGVRYHAAARVGEVEGHAPVTVPLYRRPETGGSRCVR
ncbi:hypothetical protein MRA01_48250 [Methylobacterium radiotolerans]|nr:hypothetical protein MRA01_48250 [Methylobacterium radiotolerans]